MNPEPRLADHVQVAGRDSNGLLVLHVEGAVEEAVIDRLMRSKVSKVN